MFLRSIYKYKIIYLFIFAVLIALSILKTYSVLNNTIDKNGRWNTTKIGLEKYLMGMELPDTLQALSGNYLNLSSWFGYNEFYSNQLFSPKSVEFDFLLEKGQFFYFIFNKNNDQSSMIRISNSLDFPSASLLVEQSGKFLSYNPIEFTNFPVNKWHHLSINQIDTNKIQLSVDNKVIIIDEKFYDNHQIGFRGSQYKVLVDNLTIKDVNQKIIFYENFKYHHFELTKKIIILSILIFFIELIFLYKYKFKNKNTIKKNIIKISIINLILLIFIFIIYFYIRLVYSSSYPNFKIIIDEIKNKISEIEDYIPIEKRYPTMHTFISLYEKFIPTDLDKIYFIGTSQTWGAGAQKEVDTMVSVFESNLINKYGSNKYQIVNTGISGSTSTELLYYYKNYWMKNPPKIIAINLSNNDRNYNVFYSNLSEFIRINKKNNIKTVFILEANSFEQTPESLQNHQAMIELSNSQNIPIIDLHQYLKDKKNQGILWWDSVHLTNYGYQLSGEYIYKKMQEMVL